MICVLPNSSERPPAVPPHQLTVVTAEVHSTHQVPNSGGQQFFSQSSNAALLTPQTPPVTMQQYPRELATLSTLLLTSIHLSLHCLCHSLSSVCLPPSAPSRPAQQMPAERSTDFIYDPTDAWNYYLKFVKVCYAPYLCIYSSSTIVRSTICKTILLRRPFSMVFTNILLIHD